MPKRMIGQMISAAIPASLQTKSHSASALRERSDWITTTTNQSQRTAAEKIITQAKAQALQQNADAKHENGTSSTNCER